MKVLTLNTIYREYLKWLESLKICLARNLNYKINFLLMMVVPVVVFFAIKYNLWRSIYASNPQTEIQGYTLSKMIEYQFWILIFDLFVRSHFFSENISDDIRLGKISAFLLYPFSFISYQLSLFFSDKLIQFFIGSFCFALVLSLGWLKAPSLFILLKAGVFLLIICLFWFFVQMGLGFLSFWFEKTWSLNVSVRFISAFFSGSIIPLDLYPEALAKILLWTPFPYLIYFPVKILMKEEVSISSCLFVLSVWIIILFFVTKWLWKKGLNFYTGAGI